MHIMALMWRSEDSLLGWLSLFTCTWVPELNSSHQAYTARAMAHWDVFLSPFQVFSKVLKTEKYILRLGQQLPFELCTNAPSFHVWTRKLRSRNVRRLLTESKTELNSHRKPSKTFEITNTYTITHIMQTSPRWFLARRSSTFGTNFVPCSFSFSPLHSLHITLHSSKYHWEFCRSEW